MQSKTEQKTEYLLPIKVFSACATEIAGIISTILGEANDSWNNESP